jgi:hypothetical protein
MSVVFQNIDPPPPTPHPLASVYPPPPPLVRGEDTLAGWKGGGGHWGVNILEDVRHCSVLYIRKYFVRHCFTQINHRFQGEKDYGTLHSTSRST